MTDYALIYNNTVVEPTWNTDSFAQAIKRISGMSVSLPTAPCYFSVEGFFTVPVSLAAPPELAFGEYLDGTYTSIYDTSKNLVVATPAVKTFDTDALKEHMLEQLVATMDHQEKELNRQLLLFATQQPVDVQALTQVSSQISEHHTLLASIQSQIKQASNNVDLAHIYTNFSSSF